MTALSAGAPIAKDILQSSIDKQRSVDFDKITKAAWEQKLDLETVLGIQSPCKENNSDMKGIQRVIKNLQNDLERIKRFSNVSSAFDALTNEDVEPWKSIKKVINFSTTDISGYVKNIMGGVRGWVMNTIQNKVKEVLPFLFPGEMPSFLDKVQKGLTGISCAFAKIVRGLAKTVGNLLLQMIDKFINGPMCLAEGFVNNLLNEILGPIQSAISSAIRVINGVLGQISGLSSSLFNALDFVTGILNFFKCDDDKACPSVDEITLSGSGINNPEGGDPVGINPSTQNSSPSDGAQTNGAYSEGVAGGEASAAVNIVTSENSQDSLRTTVNERGEKQVVIARTPEQQQQIENSLYII